MQPQAAAWSLVPHAPGVRLWDHLGRDENDFDPFFTPKMRKMEHAGGEAGEPGAPEMGSRPAARSLSAPSKPSPRLYLDLLLLQVILEALWINWKVTKTISIPFFHLNCAKWSTPAEKPEILEPRKCNHVRLLGASVHAQDPLRGCT